MEKQNNIIEESDSDCSVQETSFSNCIVTQHSPNTSDSEESHQADFNDENSNISSVIDNMTVSDIINSDIAGQGALTFLFGLMKRFKDYLNALPDGKCETLCLEDHRRWMLKIMDLMNAVIGKEMNIYKGSTKNLIVLQNIVLPNWTSKRTANETLDEDHTTEQVAESSAKKISKNSPLNEPKTPTPKKLSKKIKDANLEANSSERRSFKSSSANESEAKVSQKISEKNDVCAKQKIPEKRSLRSSSQDATKFSKKIDNVHSEPKFFEKRVLRSSLGNKSSKNINSDQNILEKKSKKTLNSNTKSSSKIKGATSSDEYNSDIEQSTTKPQFSKAKIAEMTKSEPTTPKRNNFEKVVKKFETENAKNDASLSTKTKEGKKNSTKLEKYEEAEVKATTSADLIDDSERNVKKDSKQTLDKINKNSKRITKPSPKSKKELFRKDLQDKTKDKPAIRQQQTLNDTNNVNTGRRTSLRIQNIPKNRINFFTNRLAYFSTPSTLSATDFMNSLSAAGKTGKNLYFEIKKRPSWVGAKIKNSKEPETDPPDNSKKNKRQSSSLGRPPKKRGKFDKASRSLNEVSPNKRKLYSPDNWLLEFQKQAEEGKI